MGKLKVLFIGGSGVISSACARVAVESAKETILEVVGRPLDDQLRLECLYSYSTMGNPEIVERKEAFLGHRDTTGSGPRP